MIIGYRGVFCCSMYCLMIDKGAPPQLAAKYDGDHRAPFQSCFWMLSCPFRRIIRLDTPLRLLTNFATDTFGGYVTNRWT